LDDSKPLRQTTVAQIGAQTHMRLDKPPEPGHEPEGSPRKAPLSR